MKLIAAVVIRVGFLIGLLAFLMVARAGMDQAESPIASENASIMDTH